MALEEVLELLELLALLLDFEDFLTELEVALLSEDLEVTDEWLFEHAAKVTAAKRATLAEKIFFIFVSLNNN